MTHCLIIEDDDLMVGMLKESVEELNLQVTLAHDGNEGYQLFQENNFDLVITDLKLPGMSGLDLLSEIRQSGSDCIVIVITGYGTVETAVRAMKNGAYDFLTKPFLKEELQIVIQKALEFESLREENIKLKTELTGRHSLDNIIGKTKSMQDIYDLIEIVAPTPSTVIVQGESGTGKEMIADAIHHHSPRKNFPLVKVSCAALPINLLESELFGHEKGAFTDATTRKIGRFEKAHKGTLFLDDIDDMPPAVQVKLLRAIQERQIDRLGGSDTISVDVRLITATKIDLLEASERGTFRKDLYYRLNVVPILMPPLRDRIEDVPLLVDHFIEKFCARCQKEIEITSEALDLLMSYTWPGNVRELENLIERIVTICPKKKVGVDDIPIRLNSPKQFQARTLKSVSTEAEIDHILNVLENTNGHRRKAAKILGITAKTLWQKMRDYGINEE